MFLYTFWLIVPNKTQEVEIDTVINELNVNPVQQVKTSKYYFRFKNTVRTLNILGNWFLFLPKSHAIVTQK